jgi:hypothetical protein
MSQPTDLPEKAQGASPAVVILYICLLLVTLFTAAYLWSNKPGSTSVGTSMQTYTDSTGRFTLQYPKTWSLTLGMYTGEGSVPDWSKETRPFGITPPDAPDPSAGVIIEPFTAKEASDMITGMNNSSFDTVSLAVIGGKAAYYDTLNFVGPSGAERYTDSNYLIPDGDNSLWITFRQSYYHNYPYQKWSNNDISALKSVVSSIKFLHQ